jgi:hypothetical protein
VDFKLIPLLTPLIDLSAFRRIVPSSTVNEVDAKPLPPVAKFAELVDESLQQAVWGYWHLYAAFYFKVPCSMVVELDNYPHAQKLRLTTRADGMMAEGIISAPFDLWRDFLQWGANQTDKDFMQLFAKALYGYFSKYDFFKTLTDSVPALR